MKKTKIIATIRQFPAEVDLNELFEKLIFMEKVQQGLDDLDKGRSVSHEKVVSSFSKKWQK